MTVIDNSMLVASLQSSEQSMTAAIKPVLSKAGAASTAKKTSSKHQKSQSVLTSTSRSKNQGSHHRDGSPLGCVAPATVSVRLDSHQENNRMDDKNEAESSTLTHAMLNQDAFIKVESEL